MRLAAVFAHPDDDTYGVGGTVTLHAGDPDLEVTVILATSGEAGLIAHPSLATRESLGRVREQEDHASWEALGVSPAGLHFLGFPDGALARVRRGDLVARIAALLVEARPDVVVTFGPDGVTGHEDHVRVGEATTEAFHLGREGSGGDGFARMLYVAIPQGELERLGELLRERGIRPPDPTQPFQPRAVPDGEIAVAVDCSSVFEKKVEALRCHRTQAELEDFPFDLWPAVLGTESFVQAWPAREPGTPVLADVFEGVAGS